MAKKIKQHVCTEFKCYQKCEITVIVDRNLHVISAQEIIRSEKPFGPFICIECDQKYSYLTPSQPG